MDTSSCQGCQQRDRRIAELETRVAQLERAAKRQAAPFAKNKPKNKPKKPGRKKGGKHGRHGHRQSPEPEQVDETQQAALPEQCPACDGSVTQDQHDEQYQIELPRQPIIRKFIIHCGHCTRCGKRLRGRHPLQTSTASGAAQSQVGAGAQAAVVYLNKHAGLSHGKITDVFDKLFGISLSRGGCAQIVRRAGRKLGPVHQQIQERIKSSSYLTPDETGWRVGGRPAWLHGWVGDDGATLYAIDSQRSAAVLQEIIGSDWSGTMTHDGFSSYGRFREAAHQQCIDHALRRARGLLDKQRGLAKVFAQQVIDLCTDALRQRDQLNQSDADLDCRVRAYENCTERLCRLSGRVRRNAKNARFAKHLHKHSGCWFLFLVDPAIAATNHLAEQALKTPIVNRKVWGGNRTADGALTQAITSSVLQTCKSKAIDAFTFISNAFRGVLGDLFA